MFLVTFVSFCLIQITNDIAVGCKVYHNMNDEEFKTKERWFKEFWNYNLSEVAQHNSTNDVVPEASFKGLELNKN